MKEQTCFSTSLLAHYLSRGSLHAPGLEPKANPISGSPAPVINKKLG
ncbi:hypothetical protein J2Z48_000333 [Croceifilum oryzae]|uniref:Uncharacterized protein n=1 Tax=Croceifilum oryzae TaxID=1553429 RepID=A0AAJ1TKD2_9BACL|nr:hypothetical protein [Croceifilum oryzae]MDQ0416175.1 hypothetical protein [Croceifilum oryzae]